jgi:divalent metal cation (Fe/Co/Zn/Cd) transporter
LDSLVELLSAALVILALVRRFHLRQTAIDRAAGFLLYLLAAGVALTSVLALAGKLQPQTSPLGILITLAALLVMPVFAREKRRLAHSTANNALAADAVQSATCAYLALIALAGLVLNAILQIAAADSLAALAAIPILIQEGRRAWRGQACHCC